MGLGEVRPREVDGQASVEESNKDQQLSSTRVEPPSSQVPQDHSQALGDNQDQGNDQGGAQVEATQEDALRVDNDDDDGGPIQPQSQVSHPRIHQSIQWDHLVDNILGSIQRGVTTHSRLATFCEHYSFVSSLEPLKVEEALDDSNWVMAMQEELNNFTRNEIWELVEHPKQNVIGTKWVFRNKQDEHGVVTKKQGKVSCTRFHPY